jgi:hypothetical protein
MQTPIFNFNTVNRKERTFIMLSLDETFFFCTETKENSASVFLVLKFLIIEIENID